MGTRARLPEKETMRPLVSASAHAWITMRTCNSLEPPVPEKLGHDKVEKLLHQSALIHTLLARELDAEGA